MRARLPLPARSAALFRRSRCRRIRPTAAYYNGSWCLFQNGQLATSYTGLYDLANGQTMLGVQATSYNGLYADQNGEISYVYGGYLVNWYTGLYYGVDGNILYLYNGWLVNWYNGLYQDTNGIFLLNGGRLNNGFEGIYCKNYWTGWNTWKMGGSRARCSIS